MSDIVLEALSEVTAPEVPTIPSFQEKFDELSKDKRLEINQGVLAVKLMTNSVDIEIAPGVTKCISYADFRDIIGRSINSTTEIQTEGMLPPSGLMFLSQTPNEMKLSCYYSGGVRKLLYTRGNMDILAPNMIISHWLKKDGKDWLVTASKWFCTDLPISKLPRTFISGVSYSEHIFVSPLSNTYENATMCYGGNQMPVRYKDNNLRGLDYYYSFLWSTPFNDDLGIYALGRRITPNEWYQRLAACAKKNEPYPYTALSGWPEGVVPYSVPTTAR